MVTERISISGPQGSRVGIVGAGLSASYRYENPTTPASTADAIRTRPVIPRSYHSSVAGREEGEAEAGMHGIAQRVRGRWRCQSDEWEYAGHGDNAGTQVRPVPEPLWRSETGPSRKA